MTIDRTDLKEIDMIKVIGVRFRKAGKIYYFNPGNMEIDSNQHVIVETVRGIEYGKVVLGVKEMPDEEIVQPLKKVIRIATADDDAVEIENKEKEREAFKVCQQKIKKHSLEMKLIDSEYTFDNNKLLFYFTADGRIDFRELVKDLASVFKTRIELRQIGVRDETKLVGSIGICGLPLCCYRYLSDFHPVSIRMAKDQNLSLNPTKISGVCGRLMCCLKYEEYTYKTLNRNLPNVGSSVTMKSGEKGEVISVNIIRQRVKLVVRKENGDPEVREVSIDEIEVGKDQRRKKKANVSKEEYAELKKLEEMDKGGSGEKDSEEKKNKNRDNKNRDSRNRGRSRNKNKKPKAAKNTDKKSE